MNRYIAKVSDLEHSGIKGQKWGVRRYQNPDGSLTDEGRRRYGYGRESGSLMTKNTASMLKKGAKLGAKIGGTLGAGVVLGTAGAASVITGTAIPMWAIASATAGGAVGGLIRGAAEGAVIGGVAGSISTRKGRKYIEKYDKGLEDFERRDTR